jgi:putative FmdB family regulatory protein
MPTYEYTCAKCGLHFERLQSMSDKALTVCPKEVCQQPRWGKGRVTRAISGGAGLLFKGSGFYITDYRSENYKQGAKKDAPPSGDGKGAAPKTESATPSKPAPAAAKAKDSTK